MRHSACTTARSSFDRPGGKVMLLSALACAGSKQITGVSTARRCNQRARHAPGTRAAARRCRCAAPPSQDACQRGCARGRGHRLRRRSLRVHLRRHSHHRPEGLCPRRRCLRRRRDRGPWPRRKAQEGRSRFASGRTGKLRPLAPLPALWPSWRSFPTRPTPALRRPTPAVALRRALRKSAPATLRLLGTLTPTLRAARRPRTLSQSSTTRTRCADAALRCPRVPDARVSALSALSDGGRARRVVQKAGQRVLRPGRLGRRRGARALRSEAACCVAHAAPRFAQLLPQALYSSALEVAPPEAPARAVYYSNRAAARLSMARRITRGALHAARCARAHARTALTARRATLRRRRRTARRRCRWTRAT